MSAFQQESEYFTLIVLSMLPSVVAVVVACGLGFLLGFKLCVCLATGIGWPFLVRGLPFKSMYRPHRCHAWL